MGIIDYLLGLRECYYCNEKGRKKEMVGFYPYVPDLNNPGRFLRYAHKKCRDYRIPSTSLRELMLEGGADMGLLDKVD